MLPARIGADGYDGLASQVAHLARLGLGEDGEAAAEVPVPGGTVELLATDDFDPAAVEERLEARRQTLRGEIARLEGKLGNDGFVDRAPAEVVEGERAKLAEYGEQLERLGG